MKIFVLGSLFSTLIFFIACADSITKTDSKIDLPLPTEEQEIVKVSFCDLQKNPADYNHKLVEITTFFSHGFEDSSVDDRICSSEQCIWFEYGGTSATGTMYCCEVPAEQKRSEPLIIENIQIPLVEDENFRTFDKLLQRPPDAIAHATVVGRFFAGEKSKYKEDSTYGGFGHFGMCSLLAVQKVVSVDSQDNKLMDYRASDYYQPAIQKADRFEDLSVYDSSKDLIELQQKAESGERGWSFNEPQKVAVEALAKLLKTDAKFITGIKQIRQTQGSFDYEWKNKKEKAKYIIVVHRSYWLSFYAKDSKRVIWTVFAAYKLP